MMGYINRAYHMETKRILYLILLIIVISNGKLNADLEELFKHTEILKPVSGLVLDIALKENTVSFAKPVTIYARFRNVSENTVAIAFGEGAFHEIDQKIFLIGSKENPHALGHNFTEKVYLVPGHGVFYFALYGYILPEGETRIRLQYKHLLGSDLSSIQNAINIWQGIAISNEVTIHVKDNDILSTKEKEEIYKRVQEYVELLDNENVLMRVKVHMPLIAMAPHSVPVLVRNLEHPSNRVKMEVLQVLGKLADKSFCLAKGYDRNISFLEEIIEGYQREKDHDVKVDYLSILNFFNDVAPEKNELAVKILREVINNETDKSLRSTAAMSLLRVSKVDGINEVINRLDDISFFGKQGCLEVIYVLRDVLFEYTEDRYIPIDRLKLWWQENKDRLEAEKAEAAAARENNQMNADTTEKTQPETNRTTGGR